MTKLPTLAFRLSAAFGIFCGFTIASAFADEHPGFAVYAQFCAQCHDRPAEARSPSFASLREMDATSLREALGKNGVMEAQGKLLSRGDRFELIEYLAIVDNPNQEWLTSLMCSADETAANLDQPIVMSTTGVNNRAHRKLSATQAQLTSAQLGNLELAWVIGFPNTSQLRTSPIIIGNQLFYSPAPTGKFLAMQLQPDAPPCINWAYDAGTAIRTSASYAQSEGRHVIVFADRRGFIHAIDARSGTRLWRQYAPHSKRSRVTGTPVIHNNKVIVNISGSGVGRAMDPTYECCVEHGSVTALELKTGNKLWTYHTMVDATYTGERSRTGVKLRGPSGAPIWSTPTIDAARNLVYVTTGENTSLPATDTSDAVIALNIETGEQVWVFQALARDVWNMSCRVPWEESGSNCPSPNSSVLKDFDFGASAILAQTNKKQDILLAGQKSGDLWALNPNNGKLLWNTKFGVGTPLGGIHWGIAIDDTRVFAAIYDPSLDNSKVAQPGINAVNISSGEIEWQYHLKPDCSAVRKQRYPLCGSRFGLSAAPLVVDGSVITAGADGRLFIFDGASGTLTFQYDTLKEFDTVNGIKGRGGSIDSHSIFAGAGHVFVGSGYGSFGQPAGNLLLAFKPAQSSAVDAAPDR